MRTPRNGSIQFPNEPPLSDSEIEDFIGHLWENIDAVPLYVQSLLHDSQQAGKTGAVAYALVAGWVLGKFEYIHDDPWGHTRSGWQPKEKDTN